MAVRGLEQGVRILDNGYRLEKLTRTWADIMQSETHVLFDHLIPQADRNDYQGKAFVYAWDRLTNNKPDQERLVDHLNKMELLPHDSAPKIGTDEWEFGDAQNRFLRGVLPQKVRHALESKGRDAHGEVGFRMASTFATAFGRRSLGSGGFIYALSVMEEEAAKDLTARTLGLTSDDIEARLTRLPWWDALDLDVSDGWVQSLSPDQQVEAARCSTQFLNGIQRQRDQVLAGISYTPHLAELMGKVAQKLGGDWNDIQIDTDDPNQNQERADRRKYALQEALWASDWFTALPKSEKRAAANLVLFYSLIPQRRLRNEAARDLVAWASQSPSQVSQALADASWFREIQTIAAVDIANRATAYAAATPSQIEFLRKLVIHLPRIRTGWLMMLLGINLLLMRNAWSDKKLALPFKIGATLRTFLQARALTGDVRFVAAGELERYRWRTWHKLMEDILDLMSLLIPALRAHRKMSAALKAQKDFELAA